MPKICGITTLPVSIKSFMLGNLNYMAEKGFESYCICSPGDVIDGNSNNLTKYIPVKEMKWGYMGPISFVKCVYRLYSIFKKEKFDIIQYATANAILCASIAGYLAKVPVRIYCEWGIGYPVSKGFKKWLYYYGTLIPCKLSTVVQPDSLGNLKFSIEDKLYPANKGYVLHNGSACGVDLDKFNYANRKEWRESICNKYNLNRYTKVFGYVGRLVVEKGINELMDAFLRLNNPNACLFLVGSTEYIDKLHQQLLQQIRNSDNVFITGQMNNPEVFYAAFDFLLLPSYQEGFGMTILEAAAVGTPSIITNIKGPTDLIVDGENGLVCKPKSADSLFEVMAKACAIENDDYNRMCNEAYNRAVQKYDSRVFKQKFYEDRTMLLAKALKK